MSSFSLLSVIGIEIEYMLVDKYTLEVRPCSDLILNALAGHTVNEYVLDDIAISNELVKHVIELKNNGPKPLTAPIALQFQQAIGRLKPVLDRFDLILLPSGAHPWMNPLLETKRWEHDNTAIYQQYDTIFDCKGHGWSNLQSMHVNLPFADDEEFSRLHNAIRLILPLLPALAASTPFLEGTYQHTLCSRLNYYERNQQRIPIITGEVIPEFICSEHEYQERILQPMYQAISPFDPDKLLQHEWLNSRAAIPKFNYGAIEIRILDSQECVKADVAIARAVWAVLKHWTNNPEYYLEHPCATNYLKHTYDQSKLKGFHASIDHQVLRQQWQVQSASTILSVWSQLLEQVSSDLDDISQTVLDNLLTHGNLSQRLIKAAGENAHYSTIKPVYQRLSQCLAANELFFPD